MIRLNTVFKPPPGRNAMNHTCLVLFSVLLCACSSGKRPTGGGVLEDELMITDVSVTAEERAAALQRFAQTAEQGLVVAAGLDQSIEKRDAIPSQPLASAQVPLAYLESRQLDTGWNTVTRVSSQEAFNGFANHAYSRRQPWNANETLLDIGNKIVDATDYHIVLADIQISSERTWSNLFPDIMYGIYWNDNVNGLVSYNVRSDAVAEIAVLHGYRDCTFGNGEGSISLDDQWVVLSCTANGDSAQQRTLLNVSLIDGTVKATLAAEKNLNWASVSPSGAYIIVENNQFPDPAAELRLYNAAFGNQQYIGKPSHGDFGVDEQGNEVFVQVGEQHVTYVVLDTAQRHTVGIAGAANPAGYGHISCRNIHRPGWCYLSSRLNDVQGAFLVSQTRSVFEFWGAHRSSYATYRAQPKAVPNRFGTKLLFSSDWNGAISPSDFLIEIPNQ